jgi:hypothetical protein
MPLIPNDYIYLGLSDVTNLKGFGPDSDGAFQATQGQVDAGLIFSSTHLDASLQSPWIIPHEDSCFVTGIKKLTLYVQEGDAQIRTRHGNGFHRMFLR